MSVTTKFADGAPTPDTAERLYDNLDLMRGVEDFEPISSGSNGHDPHTHAEEATRCEVLVERRSPRSCC